MTASVSLAGGDRASHRTAATGTAQVPSGRVVLSAVGALMAMTPATAREAERMLSAAALRTGLPETVLAAAVLDASRGIPVLARTSCHWRRMPRRRSAGSSRSAYA
ncbi:hypothetical protein ACWC98_11080 [Streptomyces goshikiensis]|uniref:hypothetical protein n=1 Tax=Streptomyces goshikiensis TaxID=1942 RepID=UPI00331C96D5